MIIVLVNSSSKLHYQELKDVQLETWANPQIVPDNCKVYFYECDVYNQMHVPFKNALINVLKLWPDVKYIFRTNASSYVDLKKLNEFSQSVPKEKFYAGINGGGFASGCGFWLSADLIPFLSQNITSEDIQYEDGYIGALLVANGITISHKCQRCDIGDGVKYFDTYHYRCKDWNDHKKTIENIKLVHRLKGYNI